MYYATGQVSLVPGQTVRIYPAAVAPSGPLRVTRPVPGQLLVPNFATADEAARALHAALAAAASS